MMFLLFAKMGHPDGTR